MSSKDPDRGYFVKAYQSTPYSDKAIRMSEFLDIEPLYAAALAWWVWLYNMTSNRTADLVLSQSTLRMLDLHLKSAAGTRVDAEAVLDAMEHAGWVEYRPGKRSLVAHFTTWDEMEGRDLQPGSRRKDGTNPRATGTNPRSRSDSPSALRAINGEAGA